MSTTNTMPSEALQRLTESRLDAVDRALMGLIPRNERLATVAQIETRIRELAAADSVGDASQRERAERERLNDLVRMGEGAEEVLLAGSKTTSARPPKRSQLALSSGILGIAALVLLFFSPIAYFIIAQFGSNEVIQMSLLVTLVAVVAVGGTAAVVLGIVALVRLNRRAGRLAGHGWAVTGLCTGPLPMVAGGLIALIAGMQSITIQAVDTVSVQTAAMPPSPMVAPYGQPPQDAALPPSSPPPSMYATPSTYAPASSDPAGNLAPAGVGENLPTSPEQSASPSLGEVPQVGLETSPDFLPPEHAAPAQSLPPAPAISE